MTAIIRGRFSSLSRNILSFFPLINLKGVNISGVPRAELFLFHQLLELLCSFDGVADL